MSDDFEYQLQQELIEKERSSGQTSDNKANTYKDKDGTEYEWNHSMKAWVPKIDEDFIAKYQSNYQYVETTTAEDVNKSTEASNADQNLVSDPQTSDKPYGSTDPVSIESGSAQSSKNNGSDNNKKQFVSKLLNKRKAEPEPQQWFDISDEHNTKVYVSDLPLDTTDEEFLELMKKCGLIEKNEKNEYKVKLYRDSNGELKGDGLCTYIKIESVELALNILDGYQFKDKTISVQRAKFSLKGEFDPALKPKRKKRDKNKEKKKIEKLFDWRPEKLVEERHKSEKTVVIKNMFDPNQFLKEPKLILEYRSDLRDESNEKCGEVKRVDIYDCHPEGVATITFAEFGSADRCVQLMNGRFFAGRRLTAHLWDGKTKYKINETEEEAEERYQKWEEFLEEDN